MLSSGRLPRSVCRARPGRRSVPALVARPVSARHRHDVAASSRGSFRRGSSRPRSASRSSSGRAAAGDRVQVVRRRRRGQQQRHPADPACPGCDPCRVRLARSIRRARRSAARTGPRAAAQNRRWRGGPPTSLGARPLAASGPPVSCGDAGAGRRRWHRPGACWISASGWPWACRRLTATSCSRCRGPYRAIRPARPGAGRPGRSWRTTGSAGRRAPRSPGRWRRAHRVDQGRAARLGQLVQRPGHPAHYDTVT